MIHDVLKRAISEAAARLSGVDGSSLPEVTLGPPRALGATGDLSTTVAFPLSKLMKL